MTVPSDSLEPSTAPTDRSDIGVLARVEALQRQSCWGTADPSIVDVRHRSAPGFVRRSLWAERWKRRHESAPSCLVCGRLWTPRTGDLHELAPSLGHRLEDLIGLCWAHHAALHRTIRSMEAWRHRGPREMSRDALLVLQQRHRAQAPR